MKSCNTAVDGSSFLVNASFTARSAPTYQTEQSVMKVVWSDDAFMHNTTAPSVGALHYNMIKEKKHTLFN